MAKIMRKGKQVGVKTKLKGATIYFETSAEYRRRKGAKKKKRE